MEDWRFQESPYLEHGGLRAYAGAPLRLQNEYGDCVGLGSLCVASSNKEEPLTKTQQQALVRLADWVVSDLVQCARARRQRERRQMSELLSMAQKETDDAVSEEPVLRILRTIYPDATVSLQPFKATHVEIEGRDPIPISYFEDGLWEDTDYLDDFIANSNHLELPSNRTVRIIAAPCESISGSSLLVVASSDFHRVFDDVDSWFVQTCAVMLSQMWRKRLLIEAMKAKEKFLRGFSHQLRTPIHGILGSVQLLDEELQARNLGESVPPMSALMEEASESDTRVPSMYLNIIKMAGRDLTSIVDNMITLNRWSDIAITDRHHAMHTFDELEGEIENEILRLTSGDTRYKTSIFFNHDSPLGGDSFRTDLGVLRDTLLPLVINSIQNTPRGVVSITASIHPNRKQLTVDVEDTGHGIHPDHQQRIFEPYEKIDPHAAGAGLGLTLASKFATLLNGSIDLISSEMGRGSHFRATFRDVECVSSPLPSQPLASKFNDLPSKFFNIAAGSDCLSLSKHFIPFLSRNGFTASDTIENSVIILDAVSDLEQHRTHLSRIPSDQVAICFVPTSEGDSSLAENTNNVVYASGLFTTSTLRSTLEKTHNLLLEIKSRGHPSPPLPIDPLTMLSTMYQGLNTDEKATPNPSTSNSINPGSDATVSATSQPDTAASAELPKATRILPTLKTSPRTTALIVDDNAVNLRIMEMYCRKRGIASYSATDGLQAVEIFSQRQALSAAGQGSPIELVFMDLQMPVCDGIEAMQQIRSLEERNNWSKSYKFIMTGQDSLSDRTAAEAAGGDEFFVKPVIIKQLDRVLNRYFPAFEAS